MAQVIFKRVWVFRDFCLIAKMTMRIIRPDTSMANGVIYAGLLTLS